MLNIISQAQKYSLTVSAVLNSFAYLKDSNRFVCMCLIFREVYGFIDIKIIAIMG